MYVVGVRHLLAILLIAAALIHPIAHIGDDALPCPCAHGAIAAIAPLLAVAVSLLILRVTRGSFWDGDGDFGSIPGRAPPAAA